MMISVIFFHRKHFFHSTRYSSILRQGLGHKVMIVIVIGDINTHLAA